MNFSEMATFVRTQADTDVTDAPDSSLTVYARAAYRDIQGRVFPWPTKKVEYTLPVLPSTDIYYLENLTGGNDMRFVTSVNDGDDVLIYVSPERWLELKTAGSSVGTPTVYTVENNLLKVWPLPDDNQSYTVTGYRRFADWPSGSTEPDLPREFDEVICWYMLSRYYRAQEDLELAQMYMQDYEVAVQQQIANAMRTSAVSAGPMIFGGDVTLGHGMSYDDWVKRGVEG